MKIRPMCIKDYHDVVRMLSDTPGVRLRDADSRKAVERYLTRNPGLSFIAVENEEIVGCIMSGHDGRRGYLQHLAVKPSHRRLGIGGQLVQSCLDELKKMGIQKAHIDVLIENHPAIDFWTKRGWKLRTDIHRFSFTNSENPDA